MPQAKVFAVRANPLSPGAAIGLVKVSEGHIPVGLSRQRFQYEQTVDSAVSAEAAAFFAGESFAASIMAIPLNRLVRRLRAEAGRVSPDDIGLGYRQVMTLRELLKLAGCDDPFEGMDWSGEVWVDD